MSYEGYEQCICTNGHRYDRADSYHARDSGQNLKACPYCGGQAAIVNPVDETNCNSFGIVPDAAWETLKIADAVTHTCPTCTHTKVVEEQKYRIPNCKELEAMRCWRDTSDDDGSTIYRSINPKLAEKTKRRTVRGTK